MQTQPQRNTLDMGGETFRLIDGTSSHYVSPSGRVYHADKRKLLAHSIHPVGYHYVRFKMDADEVRKNHLVHRLVAQVFIENPDNKPTVNHIDADKSNNNAGNLEWATMKEQGEHASAMGLYNPRSGEDHYLYGKSPSNEIRAKMSASKLGENHPRFKGYYHTPYGVFPSARQAEQAIKTVTHVTIGRRCKEGIQGVSDWYFQPAQAA